MTQNNSDHAMVGAGAPESVRGRLHSVQPEKWNPHGGTRKSLATHRTTASKRWRGRKDQKQKLAAGKIYNVETLVQCGFLMEDESAATLLLDKESPDPSLPGGFGVIPDGQLCRRDGALRESDKREHLMDRAGKGVDAHDDIERDDSELQRRLTSEGQLMGLFNELDRKASVESVWGSFPSVKRTGLDPQQVAAQALAAREKAERDAFAEAPALRYLLGGVETADGKKIDEATIRCIKVGASAAEARKKRFGQGAPCARLDAWTQGPGDTAFHQRPTLATPEVREGGEPSRCLTEGRRVETRNYHLHAQKTPLPTGPVKDSLLLDMPEGEERNRMDIAASLIFLNPRTHRLERKQATITLAPSAPGPVEAIDDIRITRGGATGAAGQRLPLLTDEKSLETTAKLFEAFERCHPDDAGWLLTNDIRWTLPRDQRVQEIFGLVRKQQSRKSGRQGTVDEQEQQDADTRQTCIFSWSNGAKALDWAKELLRNRDEPVQFTRSSRVKYEAMLNQLRRVESSLINDDRVNEALKISFDIFCRAFWRFACITREGTADEPDAPLPIAVEKRSPYVLTPMQMLVRDAILGVRLSPYEVRTPDYVEFGRLPLMERPDLTLSEEHGTLLIQPDERQQLLDQYAKREEASSFEKAYSHVLQVESQLAGHELLKKALGKYSRMRLLSLPADDLKRKISSIRLSRINE